MTPEQAHQVFDLQKQVDEHATNNLYLHLEKHFDAADRQIAQLAQLKNLDTDGPESAALLKAVAEIAKGGGTDPLGVT